MMPPLSALTAWVRPSTSTSTSAFSTGTLVKLRQPRAPAGSCGPREESLVSRTRPRIRSQSVEP